MKKKKKNYIYNNNNNNIMGDKAVQIEKRKKNYKSSLYSKR